MMDAPLDALPKLLIELRDNDEVAAIVGNRVRIREPAPDMLGSDGVTVVKQGDARGPGKYLAFIVLSRLVAPRDTRSVGSYPRINVRCYGRTGPEAYALYAACSGAIHHRGPRVHSQTGIYLSHDETGPTPGNDPVTQQPYEEFIATLIASTQAVA